MEYREKGLLIGKISVLLEIGYTSSEVSEFLRTDTDTAGFLPWQDKDIWERTPPAQKNDPYQILRRVGMFNEFDFAVIGHSDRNGENSRLLSDYYLWEDKQQRERYELQDYLLRKYFYRYSLSATNGDIDPLLPITGEWDLEERYGKHLRDAFGKHHFIGSTYDYVDIIKSASVFNGICMAVIERGILRVNLGADLKILSRYLNK